MTRIKSVWFKDKRKGCLDLTNVCEGGVWSQAVFWFSDYNMRWERLQ